MRQARALKKKTRSNGIFFYGDIKAKEKDVADTEKKLVGANKQVGE